MAMANMNLIGVFVTKLWPVQTLACGGGDGGGDGGGATKTIISPKFSNFGDIIIDQTEINKSHCAGYSLYLCGFEETNKYIGVLGYIGDHRRNYT